MQVNCVTKNLVYWSYHYFNEFDEQDLILGGAMSTSRMKMITSILFTEFRITVLVACISMLNPYST